MCPQTLVFIECVLSAALLVSQTCASNNYNAQNALNKAGIKLYNDNGLSSLNRIPFSIIWEINFQAKPPKQLAGPQEEICYSIMRVLPRLSYANTDEASCDICVCIRERSIVCMRGQKEAYIT